MIAEPRDTLIASYSINVIENNDENECAGEMFPLLKQEFYV